MFPEDLLYVIVLSGVYVITDSLFVFSLCPDVPGGIPFVSFALNNYGM